MELVENRYEQQPLLALPPKERDLAEDFLSRLCLAQLLQKQTRPDLDILKQYHLSSNTAENDWAKIIAATLVAKTTYILPNPNFTKEEILYLIKLACKNAGYPLENQTLAEIIKQTQGEMPILSTWLTDMAGLLKITTKHSTTQASAEG